MLDCRARSKNLATGVNQFITRFLGVLTTGIKIQNKERGRLWIDGHLLGCGFIRHVASLPLVSATIALFLKPSNRCMRRKLSSTERSCQDDKFPLTANLQVA